MNLFKILPIFFLFFIACSSKPEIILNEIEQNENLIITTTNENKYVNFNFPKNFNANDTIINQELKKFSKKINYFELLNTQDSSFVNKIYSYFNKENQHPYRMFELNLSDTSKQVKFKIDSNKIHLLQQILQDDKTDINKKEIELIDDFSYIEDGQLLFPCPNIEIPLSLNLLPNASRKYRSGIHQGIDFAGNYDSEVRSVFDGVIIRSDLDYYEVSNEFRNDLLKKASIIQRTPSDIFVNILYGRTVMIDHGFSFTKDKRIISIYAHLSKINPQIKVGKNISRGDIIGKVGNSGTSDGAKGNRKSAHLHFELIIQDKNGERYLGKNIYNEELLKLLNRVFSHK